MEKTTWAMQTWKDEDAVVAVVVDVGAPHWGLLSHCVLMVGCTHVGILDA